MTHLMFVRQSYFQTVRIVAKKLFTNLVYSLEFFYNKSTDARTTLIFVFHVVFTKSRRAAHSHVETRAGETLRMSYLTLSKRDREDRGEIKEIRSYATRISATAAINSRD